MRFTFHRLDLSAYPGGQPPHDLIERQGREQWLVPQEPVAVDRPVRWSLTRQESRIHIPLFAYVTPPEPELALGFAFQLGLQASQSAAASVLRLHLSLGHPVQELVDQHTNSRQWRLWIGFALQVEQPRGRL